MRLCVTFGIRAEFFLGLELLLSHVFSAPNTFINALPNFDIVPVMSASMTLEEKFKALMKNYEAMTTNNEEL